MTGILALQGGYEAHRKMVLSLNESCALVRTEQDLSGMDRLILPGGESTVMIRLLTRYGLLEGLRKRIEGGMPVFGTCAGLILLSRQVEDSELTGPGGLDLRVRRNAYGRQIESFETDLTWEQGQIRALFIRAPEIIHTGGGVEILSSLKETPVLVRQKNCLAASFHPELTGYREIHRYFLKEIG